MEAPKCAWGCRDLVDVTRLRDWRWEMIWPCSDGLSGKHGVLLAGDRGKGHVMMEAQLEDAALLALKLEGGCEPWNVGSL